MNQPQHPSGPWPQGQGAYPQQNQGTPEYFGGAQQSYQGSFGAGQGTFGGGEYASHHGAQGVGHAGFGQPGGPSNPGGGHDSGSFDSGGTAKPRRRIKLYVFGALALVLLLAIAAGGGYFYLNNGDRPNQKTAEAQIPGLLEDLLEAERHGDSVKVSDITCRKDHEKPDFAENLSKIENFNVSDGGYTDIDVNEITVRGDSARVIGMTRYKKETSGYEGYFLWEDGHWKGCGLARDDFNAK